LDQERCNTQTQTRARDGRRVLFGIRAFESDFSQSQAILTSAVEAFMAIRERRAAVLPLFFAAEHAFGFFSALFCHTHTQIASRTKFSFRRLAELSHPTDCPHSARTEFLV
jgi:hypothetical protein